MIAVFQRDETVCESADLWKTETKAGVRFSAHIFKRKAETPSGPVGLLVFIFLASLVTSPGLMSVCGTGSESSTDRKCMFVEATRQDIQTGNRKSLKWQHYLTPTPGAANIKERGKNTNTHTHTHTDAPTPLQAQCIVTLEYKEFCNTVSISHEYVSFAAPQYRVGRGE